MQKAYKSIILLCLISALLMPSCASQGGSDYTRTQERRAMSIQYGTLLSVREVNISNEPTGTGTGVGAVAGGVLGSLIGRGKGRILGVLGGAAVGAIGGTAVEKGLADGTALELTVRLDTGREIVVVQDKDEFFSAGDKVRVLTSGDGVARVQLYK